MGMMGTADGPSGRSKGCVFRRIHRVDEDEEESGAGKNRVDDGARHQRVVQTGSTTPHGSFAWCKPGRRRRTATHRGIHRVDDGARQFRVVQTASTTTHGSFAWCKPRRRWRTITHRRVHRVDDDTQLFSAASTGSTTAHDSFAWCKPGRRRSKAPFRHTHGVGSREDELRRSSRMITPWVG